MRQHNDAQQYSGNGCAESQQRRVVCQHTPPVLGATAAGTPNRASARPITRLLFRASAPQATALTLTFSPVKNRCVHQLH